MALLLSSVWGLKAFSVLQSRVDAVDGWLEFSSLVLVYILPIKLFIILLHIFNCPNLSKLLYE